MKTKEKTGKLISILLIGLICFYISGHLSAVVNSSGINTETLSLLGKHIADTPFHVLHFHPIVFIYAFGIWLVGSITILSSRISPKADMKGTEKGSNDFMTEKEIKEFLKNNTTRCR